MHALDLARFNLRGLLGHGANYEVYDAIDRETGKDVVLKRPWPQCLRAGQHRSIDEQSARLIEVHRLLGERAPHISHLIGYAGPARHDSYFGDSLVQDYYVLVEERARGVPLVADIKDRFRGIPIGLGQTLFALYPLGSRSICGAGRIFAQLLDVEEAFARVNRVILDLRPQNVYFDPKRGEITVIDLGMSVDVPAVSGSPTGPDVHDCLAELCKYYLAPHSPPTHINGYREPFGMGPALGFTRELDRMIQACSSLANGALHDIVVGLLHRIKRRDYGSIAPFRRDLQQYFALLDERNRDLQDLPNLVDVWREGIGLLKDNYWRKFLFDPEADLARYA
jgi:serine/threonine protein kinase